MTRHDRYLDEALRAASPQAHRDTLATITHAVWHLLDAHLPPRRVMLGAAAYDPLSPDTAVSLPDHGPDICGWDLDRLADLTHEAETTPGEKRIGAALRAWFTDHDLDPDQMGGAAAGDAW